MEGQRVASIVVFVGLDGELEAYVDLPRRRQCRIGKTQTLHALLALALRVLSDERAVDAARCRVTRSELESEASRLVEGASLEQLRWMLSKMRAANDQSKATAVIEAAG